MSAPPPWSAAPVRRQAGVALILVGWLLGAGALVGILWSFVAPTVALTAVEDGLRDLSFQSGRFFIAEGMYAVLAASGGVASALVVRRWIRVLGWPVVVALAVGGALASLVAWRVGVWLGPDDLGSTAISPGQTVELPLRLRSGGLLLVWSIAAVVVALLTMLGDAGASSGDRHTDGATDPRAGPDPAELAAWAHPAESRPEGQARSTR